MVIRDDAFDTIVAAVRRGRIIFDNIRRSAIFMLCTNLAEILAVGIASAANTLLPLLPLQILYLNLLTDVFPALALGVGRGSRDVLDDPPRPSDEGILTKREWKMIGAWGWILSLCVLACLYLAGSALGREENAAITVSFLTLGFSKMLFVFNLGVEVALWSVGIRTLTGGRAQPGAWKKMISPPVIAIVLGVVLNQLGGGTWMPQPIMKAFDFLGAASIPIALIITGALLADNTSWETLRSGIKTAVAAVALRNLALPLLFLLLAGWFTKPVELQNVLITQSAMPSAMAPLMLARYYQVNPIPALLVIVSTTLMCVVTTPIWITVGRLWWQGGGG